MKIMDKDNKELLLLAAKAAGILPLPEDKELDYTIDGGLGICGGGEYIKWSPLQDDGDAFWLLVELELNRFDVGAIIMNYTTGEEYRADKFAAVRLGITRFAAEIGER